ncbi:LOW QUALITY PROTEIN: protein max-like [Zalophus californianus]|uniref:Protein max n=1 Tax=Zalophus californianus TaxID=9704 RepID=A0A6P9FK41_ZALCA|nr:LOW QUALITY PROTEIN: protein max-like [Zalophus californianus]
MSDNNDMEVESYEEQPRFQSATAKQAHHNALEQKRSDYIKDSFQSLWDAVPSLQGQQTPWAQILDKATEYIQYMQRKNYTHQQDIEDLEGQNAFLEQQVCALEKARSSVQLQTNYPPSDNSLYTNAKGSTISAFNGGSHCSLESELEEPQSNKKLQMGNAAIQTVRVLHRLTLLSGLCGTAMMFCLFTAGGKDGERISPVVATWCILVEDGSLWFSWMMKLPSLDAYYGLPTRHYPFPISLPGVSRPGKEVLHPGQ